MWQIKPNVIKYSKGTKVMEPTSFRLMIDGQTDYHQTDCYIPDISLGEGGGGGNYNA